MIKQQETYTWSATLEDGSKIDESDVDSFTHIDKNQVSSIALLAEGTILHQVNIPDDAYPVFFRRRALTLGPDAQSQDTAAHCIGWLRDGQGVYLFILPDGSTLLTDDLQAI